MAKFCKLPEEMVVQTLSRLPPKSLIRFRCVRKLWYNVINNPSFVAKNLANNMNNKFASSTSILFKHMVLTNSSIKDEKEIFDVVSDGNPDTKKVLLSLLDLCNDNDGDGQDYSIPEVLIVRPSLGLYPRLDLEIVGHCDGIICLNDNVIDNIVLCNPAIKEFKILPKSCLLLPPRDRDDYDAIESDTNAVGFGYDSKAQEYKVVRIVSFLTGVNYTLPSRAEVYTLGANSWREVQAQTESFVFWAPSFKLFFKGMYFWWASIGPLEQEVILSFDMNDEVFHNIHIPDCIRHDNVRYGRSLAVWNESIVLLTYGGDCGAQSFEIWQMDDFGVFKGSWTKYVTIGPVEDIAVPLIFWKNDELLMVGTNGYVVSYNFGIQMLKYLPIHGVKEPSKIQATVYVNSIISVLGSNKLEALKL